MQETKSRISLKSARGSMSIKELAKRLGVSYQIVYCYESGLKRPRPEVAERIAALFALRIEDVWDMFYASKESVQ